MTQVKVNIKRLAELAGLVIPENHYAKVENDLANIIEYFSILDPVDVSGIGEITSAGSRFLMPREDDVHDDGPSREELLTTSPQKIAANQIVLDSIMQSDEN